MDTVTMLLAAVILAAAVLLGRKEKRKKEETYTAQTDPRALGRSLLKTEAYRRDGTSAARIRDLRQLLSEALDRLQESPTEGLDWARDHGGFVETELLGLQETVKQDGRALPACGGRLRADLIAEAMVQKDKAALDAAGAEEFLAQLQETCPLTLEELDALPLYIKLHLAGEAVEAILCTVREDAIARRGAQDAQRGRKADEEQLFAGGQFHPAYAEQYALSLGQTPGEAALWEALRERLYAAGYDPDEIGAAQRSARLYWQEKGGNAIRSLRFWEEYPQRSWIRAVSPVDRILEEDDIYCEMEEDSRNAYRAAVAYWAKKLHAAETFVARTALECAKAGGGDPKRSHIGYYLADRGIADLARRMGQEICRQEESTVFVRIQFFWWLLSAAIVLGAFAWGGVHWLIALWLPARQGSWEALRHWRAPSFLHRIPCLKVEKALPQGRRMLLTLPVLAEDAETVGHLFDRLEGYYCGNSLAGVHCVLLVDLPESQTEEDPAQQEILDWGQDKARALCERYGQDSFVFLMRRRVYSATQRAYLGRERKRGALEALNRLVQLGEIGDFLGIDACPQGIFRADWVFCIDMDTQVLPGTLAQFAGALAHPLNAPKIQNGRVTEGYGLIVPAVENAFTSAPSGFERVMAGEGGLDSYGFAGSEFHQEHLGQSIFMGKGAYWIDAAIQTAGRWIAPERVLSHDLLEGCFLRAGRLEGAVVLDAFPKSFVSYLKRAHRWVRGDWQLVPYLFPVIRDAAGVRRRNPLTIVHRGWILQNLVRSLTPAALTLLPLWGVYTDRPWWGLILTALYFFLPVLTRSAWEGLRSQERNRDWQEEKLALARAGFEFLTLPLQTWTNLCAAAVSLWRLTTRRGLLTWTTAAQTEKVPSDTLRKVLFYAPQAFFCAGLAALGWLRSWPEGVAAALFWLFGIGASVYLDRPAPKDTVQLSEAERETLLRYTRDTWHYFDSVYTQQDHFLPPDNVQKEPVERVAHRTSPTNMGFALIAQFCAAYLGFQGMQEACQKVRMMLDTMLQLERYRGHWYNWYDTQTLGVLEPRYISSVDSGNLTACLFLASAIAKDRDAELSCALEETARSVDLAALYDSQRELFAIGCDHQGTLSGAYDLAASEARLTSFLAVATGQVPRQHWYALGRAAAKTQTGRMLLSWGGTWFEYLMPTLFLREPKGSLLGEAAQESLAAQRRYARALGLPIGITESGFAAFDRDMNYQYRAFGVPECAMKQEILQPRVVAPYVSAMALPLAKREMMENLARLEKLGAYDAWGFCEAVDFEPSRMRPGENHRVVRSAMSHHQGMILMALTGELCADILREKFAELPFVRGAKMLLGEKKGTGAGVHRAPLRVTEERRDPSAVFPVQMWEGKESGMPIAALLQGKDLCAAACSSGMVSIRHRETEGSRFRPEAARLQGLLAYTRIRGGGSLRLGDEASCVLEGHRARYVQKVSDLHQEASFWADPRSPILDGGIVWTNGGKKDITVECTLCLEPSLTGMAADLSHRAYQGLFMECGQWENGIYALRRPQKESEEALGIALAVPQGESFSWTFSRASALGRGQSWQAPQLLEEKELPCEAGAQTDPVLCLRRTVTVPAGESAEWHFMVIIGKDAQMLQQLCTAAGKKADRERSLDLAWHQQQSILQSCRMTPRHLDLAQKLLPYLLFERPMQQARSVKIAQVQGAAEDLWAWGIPTDHPIVTLRIDRLQDAEKVHHLALCQRYLREKGQKFTLAVLYRDAGDYPQTLAHALEAALRGCAAQETSGGIYLLREEPHTSAQIDMLLASSRLILQADRVLTHQLVPQEEMPRGDFGEPSLPIAPPEDLEGYNGWGGFDPKGRYYRISPMMGRTPLPWSQVIASGSCGAVLTADFGGYLFAGNSQKEPMTEFAGDAVQDPSFMDVCWEAEGKRCRLSAPGAAILYPGGIRYQYASDGFRASIDLCAPFKGDMLVMLLGLRSRDGAAGEVTLAPHLRLLPATHLGQATLWCPLDGGLLAKNSPQRAGTVFMAMPGSGTDGDVWRTDAPELHMKAELLPGQTQLMAWVIGKRDTEEEAREAIRNLPPVQDLADLADRTQSEWERRLGNVKLHCADRDLCRMVNTFLPYQAWACRLLARAGYYQNGGAYGFRDQLQDAVSLLWYDPSIARRQICLCAAHQFEEGDVQHWWHEPALGVRTRMTDDRLFLPWAVLEYIRFTGDEKILCTQIPYLAGEPLAPGQEDRYEEAKPSEVSEDLFLHCVRAVEVSFSFGAHGLPLMGTGDWNDAMNRVGHGGKGESVFVALLLLWILPRMRPYLEKRGDAERLETWKKTEEALRQAVETHAWDGQWYRRAYKDDGSPLGSRKSSACRIDALTQAWAVFALGVNERTNCALTQALEQLWDREHHLFALLDPPFTRMGEAGYISGYQAGIRENGGQYTHAAAWMVLALCEAGRREEAYRLLCDLLPPNQTNSMEKVLVYEAEPYAAAADVYRAPGMMGHAGWTWYTGSAGWLLRAALEGILGAKKEAGGVTLAENIPESLGEVELHYRGKSCRPPKKKG